MNPSFAFTEWSKLAGSRSGGREQDVQAARQLLIDLRRAHGSLSPQDRAAVTEVLRSLSNEQTGATTRRDRPEVAPRGRAASHLAKRDRTFTEPLILVTTFWLLLFHVGAVAALFAFSWKAFAICALLWWIATSLGIGVGYHRLLTHRGYKTPKVIEYFLTICGTLALQGGPIPWVATHRVHHQAADKTGDPHSPRDGGFWAHMGWIMTGRAMYSKTTELLAYVPDLRKDRFHLWITRWHWMPLVVLGIGLFVLGGWKYVLWGIFLRTVVGMHVTWLVNSATHMWGSRRFETRDASTNSFWVAILTFGEGWHNNHHAHPQSARHGLAWYEFDLNWYEICALRKLHLASDIKLPRPQSTDGPSYRLLA